LRLRTEGVIVVEVTVTPEIEGSIGSFLRAVLTPYRHLGGSAVQAREALANILLSAYPFLDGYQKCVFVVDEAQGLKSNNLEVLRGLYDLGDAARNGNAHSPAFGLVLVGNDTFLNKGGRHQKAEFRPLMSRVMINLMLSRPDKVELSNLARGLLPENIEAQAILVQFGSDAGSLRAIDKAHRLAMSFVQNGDDLLVALRRAVSLPGGR
jgi:DNA transposition AAA+ family ATPase